VTRNMASETSLVEAQRPVVRASSLMRAVNTLMRSLSSGVDAGEPIAIFCECEVDACFAICWMTRTELQARLEHGDGWILADGHEGSEPWSGRALPARTRAPACGARPRRLSAKRFPGKDARGQRVDSTPPSPRPRPASGRPAVDGGAVEVSEVSRERALSRATLRAQLEQWSRLLSVARIEDATGSRLGFGVLLG